MTLRVATDALFILKTLRNAGFYAYIVGGAVRDLLMRKDSLTDYDFTTNATPEQLLALFANSFYENQFGTVMITPTHLHELMGISDSNPTQETDESDSHRIIDIARATKLHPSLADQSKTNSAASPEHEEQKSAHNYEITTYRSDGSYDDHRRPTSVTWGSSLSEDLSRRDFTINALALKIADATLSSIDTSLTHRALEDGEYQIIDHYDGIKDLDAGIIRTVGDATTRFHEDALRMLRAIRLAAQLSMQIDNQTYEALSKQSDLITHVSFERIRDEFIKMLLSPHPKQAIEMLDGVGLLKHIMPELLEAQNIEQAGHHTTDVWTHLLDSLESCPSRDPIVKLATLLHDIAKPNTRAIVDGKPTFYNHEVVGARIARNIAARLKLSKKDQDRIFTLVRHHMFHYQPQNTDASVRRFMRKVGLDNLDDILDVREADRLGSGARKTSWRLEEMKTRMIEQLHQPLSVTDLAINGHDLIEVLNLKPGPLLGKLLHELFEWVLDVPENNTRELLLEKAQSLLQAETT